MRGALQDCEFTYLSTQILHVLGEEGPKTKDPARYIRFIYNRIILENATVRAAAVSSLAKFGALVEDLRDRVKVLLSRALHDNDDEVGAFLGPTLDDPAGLPPSPQTDCWSSKDPVPLQESVRSGTSSGHIWSSKAAVVWPGPSRGQQAVQ